MTYEIHQIPVARDALTDDELEVQAAGGGASARVSAQSIADLGTGGGGSSPIQSATVTLTAADLAALNLAPIDVVPTQGPTSIILPVAIFVIATTGITDSYSNVSNYLFIYSGDNGLPLSDYVTNSRGSIAGLLASMGPSATNCFCAYSLWVIKAQGSSNPQAAAFDNPMYYDQSSASLQITASSTGILGTIATTALDSGGIGYAATDTFTMDNGVGGLASGVVDTVDGDGIVLTYHLTSTSGLYDTGVGGTTATSGAGTGLQINVATLDYGSNPTQLIVRTLYNVIDL